mmetsp:Transcript_16488/g.39361  ORF Transcript_16488/g.39361 Transcript_16488/m.39361 type:complete len:231 (-) Transcript_16488:1176-1868(-)
MDPQGRLRAHEPRRPQGPARGAGPLPGRAARQEGALRQERQVLQLPRAHGLRGRGRRAHRARARDGCHQGVHAPAHDQVPTRDLLNERLPERGPRRLLHGMRGAAPLHERRQGSAPCQLGGGRLALRTLPPLQGTPRAVPRARRHQVRLPQGALDHAEPLSRALPLLLEPALVRQDPPQRGVLRAATERQAGAPRRDGVHVRQAFGEHDQRGRRPDAQPPEPGARTVDAA